MTTILSTALKDSARSAQKELERVGYVVVNVNEGKCDISVTAASFRDFLSRLGKIISVFDDHGIVRPIGVKPEKEPTRSEGVGNSPLHMDFVNAENPPDYVALLCVRPDPLGGGASLIAPFPRLDELKKDDLAALSQRIFRDGRVVGLSNIGRDVNPFPVLAPNEHWSVRYTANLHNLDLPAPVHESLHRYGEVLRSRQIEVLLTAGTAIIIDQHRVAHGKTPLGKGQEAVAPDQRRELLQVFLRGANNPIVSSFAVDNRH